MHPRALWLTLLASIAGCAQLIDLDDYGEGPAVVTSSSSGGAGGGGGSDTSSSSLGGGGGQGGSGGSGGAPDPYYDAVIAAGPIAYWRLGEVTGTMARDSVGPFDAIYDQVLLGQEPLINSPDLAVLLPGDSASEKVDAGHFPELGFTGVASFTLEMWVWPIEVEYAELIRKSTGIQSTDQGYWLIVPNTAGEVEFARGDGAQSELIRSSKPLNDGGATHVVAVVDGPNTNMKIYFNALEVISGGVGVSLPTTTAHFVIGRSFKGRIDEVAIYDRPLSIAEIQDHHAIGTSVTTGDGQFLRGGAPSERHSAASSGNTGFPAMK